MSPKGMQEVYHANGMLDAEMMKLYLQSYEISSLILQESVGLVYGFTAGYLGSATVYVQDNDVDRAKACIALLAAQHSAAEDEI